jgi:hypothetical protein
VWLNNWLFANCHSNLWEWRNININHGWSDSWASGWELHWNVTVCSAIAHAHWDLYWCDNGCVMDSWIIASSQYSVFDYDASGWPTNDHMHTWVNWENHQHLHSMAACAASVLITPPW